MHTVYKIRRNYAAAVGRVIFHSNAMYLIELEAREWAPFPLCGSLESNKSAAISAVCNFCTSAGKGISLAVLCHCGFCH